jgi:hypothetical protein
MEEQTKQTRGKYRFFTKKGEDPFSKKAPVPILLVGTKIDLENKRRIGKESASRY